MAALALRTPTVAVLPHQTVAQALADKLGRLQAQIAPLRNEEAAIKSLLRDAGPRVIEGDLWRVTISPAAPTKKTDWQALCAHYGIPPEGIAAFTTVGEPGEARVTVKSRQGV